jgi:hypothetical protein
MTRGSRATVQQADMLPQMYLHSLSSGDFVLTLNQFVGSPPRAVHDHQGRYRGAGSADTQAGRSEGTPDQASAHDNFDRDCPDYGSSSGHAWAQGERWNTHGPETDAIALRSSGSICMAHGRCAARAPDQRQFPGLLPMGLGESLSSSSAYFSPAIALSCRAMRARAGVIRTPLRPSWPR